MRTANPALNERAFSNVQTFGPGNAMTLQGAVNKTYILLFLLVASASFVWSKVVHPVQALDTLQAQSIQISQTFAPFMMTGLVLATVVGFLTIFKKEWAPVTAPIYAVSEGFLLGGLSAIFELSYPGIVIQAIAIPFGTLFCLLTAYKSGMIPTTENFKLGMVAAMGAICLLYLVNFIMMFFHSSLPFISGGGPAGIIFSLIVVAIAALNLVLDFDFIEQGAGRGLPKYMEWYAAFGLMVTLIWLYMEILRLLAKLRDSNR